MNYKSAFNPNIYIDYFYLNTMRIPRMQFYIPESKCGPYPLKNLARLKKGYETYIIKNRVKVSKPAQYKRLENIIKVIELAIARPKETLNPGYLSKKLKVSETVASSYLELIDHETRTKEY